MVHCVVYHMTPGRIHASSAGAGDADKIDAQPRMRAVATEDTRAIT